MASRPPLVVFEAMAALVTARLALKLLPFRLLVPQPDSGALGPAEDVAPNDPRGLRVRYALAQAGRRLPGEWTCLVRALAGRWMLRRRGVASVLHLGVSTAQGTLAAHAWLEAAGGIVCGGREAAGFTPLASFAAGKGGE